MYQVRCAIFSQAAKAPGEIPLTVLRIILSQQLQLDGRKSFEVKVREVVVPRGSLQLGHGVAGSVGLWTDNCCPGRENGRRQREIEMVNLTSGACGEESKQETQRRPRDVRAAMQEERDPVRPCGFYGSHRVTGEFVMDSVEQHQILL
jgi:hypothetical protein